MSERHALAGMTYEAAIEVSDMEERNPARLYLVEKDSLSVVTENGSKIIPKSQENDLAGKEVEEKVDLSFEQSFEMEQFDQYMANIRKYPLLTLQQEVDLGRKVQSGIKAKERLEKDVYKSAVERSKDQTLIKEGDTAKQQFINANLRLTAKFARMLYRRNPTARRFGLMDLYQEGHFGLDHAVDLFNPEQGTKFSTYASWWINQKMYSAIDSGAAPIHIPYRVLSKLNSLRTLNTEGASDEQIQAQLGMEEQEMYELQDILRRHDHAVSLDAPLRSTYEEDVKTEEEVKTEHTLGDITEDPVGSEIIPALSSEKEQEFLLSDDILQVLVVLETFLTRRDMELLEKIMTDDKLNETDQHHALRLTDFFAHPAAMAKLKKIRPQNFPEDDWRDEANCAQAADPNIFLKPRTGKKEQAAAICGNCAVREACKNYFEANLPQKARWIDGITHTDIRLAKKGQLRSTDKEKVK